MRNKTLLLCLSCALVLTACDKNKKDYPNNGNTTTEEFTFFEEPGIYRLQGSKATPVVTFKELDSQFITSTASKITNVKYLYRAIDLNNSAYLSLGFSLSKSNITEDKTVDTKVESLAKGEYNSDDCTLYVTMVDEDLNLVWLEDTESDLGYIISK